MNNFAITAADAVSRRYKSNDPEAIIAQRAIKIKDMICHQMNFFIKQIQSHDFFKICDITSTAYLPHTGNSWFDGDSGSMMQFIFQ